MKKIVFLVLGLILAYIILLNRPIIIFESKLLYFSIISDSIEIRDLDKGINSKPITFTRKNDKFNKTLLYMMRSTTGYPVNAPEHYYIYFVKGGNKVWKITYSLDFGVLTYGDNGVFLTNDANRELYKLLKEK